MEKEDDILGRFPQNQLVELIRKIQDEFPFYKEADITSSVNSVSKKYLSDPKAKDELDSIKKDVLDHLKWSKL